MYVTLRRQERGLSTFAILYSLQRKGGKKNLGCSRAISGTNYLVRGLNQQFGAGLTKSSTGAAAKFSNLQRKRRQHRASCRVCHSEAFTTAETQQALSKHTDSEPQPISGAQSSNFSISG